MTTQQIFPQGEKRIVENTPCTIVETPTDLFDLLTDDPKLRLEGRGNSRRDQLLGRRSSTRDTFTRTLGKTKITWISLQQSIQTNIKRDLLAPERKIVAGLIDGIGGVIARVDVAGDNVVAAIFIKDPNDLAAHPIKGIASEDFVANKRAIQEHTGNSDIVNQILSLPKIV